MNSRIRSLRAGRAPKPRVRSSMVAALTRKLDSLVGAPRRRDLAARERLDRLEPDQRLREIGEW